MPRGLRLPRAQRPLLTASTSRRTLSAVTKAPASLPGAGAVRPSRKWSGRRDSNSGPRRPKRRAIPGFATPRRYVSESTAIRHGCDPSMPASSLETASRRRAQSEPRGANARRGRPSDCCSTCVGTGCRPNRCRASAPKTGARRQILVSVVLDPKRRRLLAQKTNPTQAKLQNRRIGVAERHDVPVALVTLRDVQAHEVAKRRIGHKHLVFLDAPPIRPFAHQPMLPLHRQVPLATRRLRPPAARPGARNRQIPHPVVNRAS
jgi:hypothetical protein